MSKRKRLRIISVCDSCHIKKKKCDRQSPCSTCLKIGKGSLCRYSSIIEREQNLALDYNASQDGASLGSALPCEGILTKSDLTSKVKETELFNLVEALNTSNGQLRIPRIRGMLLHVIFVTADPTTELIRTLLKSSWGEEYGTIFSGSTCLSEETILTYEQAWKSLPGYIPKVIQIKETDEVDRLRACVSEFGRGIGIQYSVSISSTLGTILSQIENVLPEARTIKLLVNVFFENQSAGFPIIDEINFKKHLERILGIEFCEKSSTIKDININSTNDLAILATLMFIMRFGYLSLLNLFEHNVRDSSNITEHAISMDAIHVAENILKEIGSPFQVNLEVLQTQTIQFLYNYVCPEGDCFIDGANLGHIVLILDTLCVNEHIEHVDALLTKSLISQSHSHFNSNLVHSIMLLDVEVSIVYGQTPKYFILSASHDNTSTFGILMPLVQLLHELILNTFGRGSKIEILKLLVDISKIQEMRSKILGNVNQYLNGNLVDKAKLWKFRLSLVCCCLILSLYYALYIFTEANTKYSLCAFYFQKAASVALGDLACIQSSFLRNCDNYFGAGSLLKLGPLLLACSRMKLIICKLGYRAQCSIKFKSGIEKLKLIGIRLHLAELGEDAAGVCNELLKCFRCAWEQGKGYNYGRSAFDRLANLPESNRAMSQAALNFSCSDLDSILCSVTRFKDETRIYKEFYVSGVDDESELTVLESIMNAIQIDRMWNLVIKIRNYVKELEFKRQTQKEDIALEMMWCHDFDFLQNLLSI